VDRRDRTEDLYAELDRDDLVFTLDGLPVRYLRSRPLRAMKQPPDGHAISTILSTSRRIDRRGSDRSTWRRERREVLGSSDARINDYVDVNIPVLRRMFANAFGPTER